MMGTRETAITTVIREVMTSGMVASEIVDRRWDILRKRLTDEDLEALARTGLTKEANDRLHRDRTWNSDGPGPSVVRVADSSRQEEAPTTLWVSVRYETRSGEIKPLSAFTVDDGQYIAVQARAKASGYLAVAEFMDTLVATLQRARVVSVQHLPAKERRALEAHWPQIK